MYDANVNTDRGTVENLRFYDTEGIESKNSSNLSEKLPKHLFSVADGVVIVYSIDDESSFQIAEVLRKEAEKHKEKKEVRLERMRDSYTNPPETKRIESFEIFGLTNRIHETGI